MNCADRQTDDGASSPFFVRGAHISDILRNERTKGASNGEWNGDIGDGCSGAGGGLVTRLVRFNFQAPTLSDL